MTPSDQPAAPRKDADWQPTPGEQDVTECNAGRTDRLRGLLCPTYNGPRRLGWLAADQELRRDGYPAAGQPGSGAPNLGGDSNMTEHIPSVTGAPEGPIPTAPQPPAPGEVIMELVREIQYTTSEGSFIGHKLSPQEAAAKITAAVEAATAELRAEIAQLKADSAAGKATGVSEPDRELVRDYLQRGRDLTASRAHAAALEKERDELKAKIDKRDYNIDLLDYHRQLLTKLAQLFGIDKDTLRGIARKLDLPTDFIESL